MSSEHPTKDGETLRKRIEAMPEDSVPFRSDFPEYHSEIFRYGCCRSKKKQYLCTRLQKMYIFPLFENQLKV